MMCLHIGHAQSREFICLLMDVHGGNEKEMKGRLAGDV